MDTQTGQAVCFASFECENSDELEFYDDAESIVRRDFCNVSKATTTEKLREIANDLFISTISTIGG